MKIVCDACQAKYSIADDKVRGKVFKIRCKKCSHVIVVRGTDDAAPVAAEHAVSMSMAAVGADAVWHIVVEGEQVGPLAEGDVRARLSRGEISGDSFIWKEGMGDWVKVSSLPEFAGDVGAGAPPPEEPSAGGFAPQPTSAYPPGMAESAFAAAGDDPFGASTTVAPSPVRGGDLFGAPAAAVAQTPVPAADPFAAFDAPAAAPVPVAAATNGSGAHSGPVGGAGLTGQRHENSVLFSLSNLEALAKPAAAPVATGPGAAARSSMPPAEGSGLIDIRAMAAMTLGKSNGSGESAASGPAPMVDLPAFGAPQFSPVSPVLLQPLATSSGPPKWVYGLVVLGLVILAGMGFMAYRLMSPPPPVAESAPTAAPAPVASIPAAAEAPIPAAVKPSSPPVTPPPSAEEKLPPREEAAGKARPAAAGAKKPVAGAQPAAGGAAAAPRAEEKKPEAPAKPKDSLDDLLAGALGGKKPAAAPVAAARPKEEEPKPADKALGNLTREDIVKGMTPVIPKAKDCYKQFKVPGNADAYITVGKTGKVTDVKVRGKFAGTPTGSCVEDAVKGAKFRENDGMNFPYPIFLP
jgi:predicted Zn finger-like uncharacterized protein